MCPPPHAPPCQINSCIPPQPLQLLRDGNFVSLDLLKSFCWVGRVLLKELYCGSQIKVVNFKGEHYSIFVCKHNEWNKLMRFA